MIKHCILIALVACFAVTNYHGQKKTHRPQADFTVDEFCKIYPANFECFRYYNGRGR